MKNTPSYLKYFLPVIVFPCDRAKGPQLFVFMKKLNMQNVFRERERENLIAFHFLRNCIFCLIVGQNYSKF